MIKWFNAFLIHCGIFRSLTNSCCKCPIIRYEGMENSGSGWIPFVVPSLLLTELQIFSVGHLPAAIHLKYSDGHKCYGHMFLIPWWFGFAFLCNCIRLWFLCWSSSEATLERIFRKLGITELPFSFSCLSLSRSLREISKKMCVRLDNIPFFHTPFEPLLWFSPVVRKSFSLHMDQLSFRNKRTVATCILDKAIFYLDNGVGIRASTVFYNYPTKFDSASIWEVWVLEINVPVFIEVQELLQGIFKFRLIRWCHWVCVIINQGSNKGGSYPCVGQVEQSFPLCAEMVGWRRTWESLLLRWQRRDSRILEGYFFHAISVRKQDRGAEITCAVFFFWTSSTTDNSNKLSPILNECHSSSSLHTQLTYSHPRIMFFIPFIFSLGMTLWKGEMNHTFLRQGWLLGSFISLSK